ncbi:MAG: hypothetical protein WA863_07220 [Methyloceanibacter sp.]
MAAMLGSFTFSTGALAVATATLGATLTGWLATFGAGLVTLGVGAATLGAGAATLAAALALGAGLVCFIGFLVGFRTASVALIGAMGFLTAATRGTDKDAIPSAMAGLGNNLGATPPFSSEVTLI